VDLAALAVAPADFADLVGLDAVRTLVALTGFAAAFFATLADFAALPPATPDFTDTLRATSLAPLPAGLRFRDVAIAASSCCRIAGPALGPRPGDLRIR
jgi:hypothetical protein